MARFIFRSIISTIVTMLLVSITLFILLEFERPSVAKERPCSGIIRKILGIMATPEQCVSFRNQLGIDQPLPLRYVDWLAGNDWRAESKTGYPLVTLDNLNSGEEEWWMEVDGRYMQFEIDGEDLVALVRQEDGFVEREVMNDLWRPNDDGAGEQFWGVDNKGRAVKWLLGSGKTAFISTQTGWQEIDNAPDDYLPLRKGMLRGDPGFSLRTNRPVNSQIFRRIRNTALLAGLAFAVVMPLALVLGIVAGVNEGKLIDRVISVGGLFGTATPEFVTGMLLILVFAIWLKMFPAVSVFTTDKLSLSDWKKFALPVLTLTTVELGYIIRMTRASMVEVMNTSYIRTAIIKGMPFKRVVFKHAIRNALMAPITIIMLHVNWLIGGIVVVEAIFGYPGLGTYIYDSAIFGDVNALEASAMVTVLVAVVTRLLGDLAYTYLNPRIRYS